MLGVPELFRNTNNLLHVIGNSFQNIITVHRHMISYAPGAIKTETVWNSMGDHIRRVCEEHNNKNADNGAPFDEFEIISGRVFLRCSEFCEFDNN